MPELGFDSRYHLHQLLKLTGPDGNQLANFGKVLTERNDMLADLPIYPSNAPLSYTGARESSLPTPQIIKIGNGWDASKCEWDNYTETISMFKDRIDINRDELRVQVDPTAKRILIRDRHIEGFGQGVANHIIYGTSVADPEKFDGLGVRYNTPDATNEIAPTNGDYAVYDMGGTGTDTCSIWLMQWGPDKVGGLHPQNDPHMGIRVEDVGLVYDDGDDSKPARFYRTELEWDLGIKIDDYRAVARIRNIESAVANIDSNLWRKLVEAKNNFKGSETVWIYVNGKIFTHLDLMTADKTNVHYSDKNPYGTPMMMFRDSPIRRCDALTETETAVAAA